jgi:diguanylate cyclase (GGDEF)-like protein
MREQKLSQAILNSLLNSVAVINPAGEIVFINDAWVEFSEKNGGDLSTCGIGANYFEVCKQNMEVYEGLRAVLSGRLKQFTSEYPCHSDDEKRWFLLQITPLIDQQIQGAVVTHINITKRKLMESQLRNMAMTDPLTSLYNRRYFEFKLNEEIEYSTTFHKPLALLIIDIDHFKTINDTYGHSLGDYILSQTSTILTNAIREADIVARYGGEEFVVLLPQTQRQDAQRIAERILTSIEKETFQIEDETIKITVSIGISVTEPHFDNNYQMFEEADKALYIAKSSGRNQICMVSSP